MYLDSFSDSRQITHFANEAQQYQSFWLLGFFLFVT